MENAVLLQADGRRRPVELDAWSEKEMAELLQTEQVRRCWSHTLVGFGAACGVALMGYVPADMEEKLPVNQLASVLMEMEVRGGCLLVYWDSHEMCSGELEPQEVERVLAELHKRNETSGS